MRFQDATVVADDEGEVAVIAEPDGTFSIEVSSPERRQVLTLSLSKAAAEKVRDELAHLLVIAPVLVAVVSAAS